MRTDFRFWRGLTLAATVGVAIYTLLAGLVYH